MTPTCYAVHLNGIDFDFQPDSDGIIWGWESLDGWFDSPEVTINQVDGFPDGSIITAARNTSRPIVLNGWAVVQGDSTLYSLAVDKLNAAMDIVTVAALMQVDEPTPKQSYVRRVGRTKTSMNGEMFALTFQVPLTAADPRKYVGTPVTDSSSWVLTGSVDVLQNTVTVAGSHELPWVATFTGGAVNPRITNNTPTHARVQWNGTLSGGDVLVFDSSTHSIILNGANAYGGVDSASVWFTLQPGNNSIFYNRDPASPSGTSTMSLSYNPAFF